MRSSDLSQPGTSQRLLRWLTPLLLILGVQCWLILGRGDYGLSFQQKLLLAALLVSVIPFTARVVSRLLDRIRHPSRRTLIISAIVIAVVAASYFPYTGWRQGRDFNPKWQDELSYIIQIQMLAKGRLWMPPHPLADFFDSFQLIVRPVYASMYFPGAAMLYVLAHWTHVPYPIASAIACGIATALLFCIITKLIDGVAGWLSVLLVLGNSMFRKLSLMVGGHPPVMLLGLGVLFCWLQWRKGRDWRWAVACGLLAGWAAITRPLDAIVFALPVAIDVLFCLWRAPLRQWVVCGAAFVAPALPLLGIQLIFNLGVTGKWMQTPFELYAERDYPGTTLGFHAFDPDRRPTSTLPQKQKFHDEWTIPAIKDHQPDRFLRAWFVEGFPKALSNLLPNRMMFVLLPVGLLGLVTRPRVMLWLLLPLFMLLFSLYTFGLPHYAIIAMPAVILTSLLGAHVVTNAWPRLRPGVATLCTLFIAILSLTEMAEFNRFIRDEVFDPSVLAEARAKLAALEHQPAVVLFHFPPDGNPHEEPVYNIDVAWPDDAPVIRAHDLGARNIEIFRYYAEKQPERAFYLYDRADNSVKFLGFARELAARE